MTYQLRTRPPTGRVPWPLILIEGGEKTGKSFACAQFSASPRIGQMYWIDLGEGSGDEYGAIPGARYVIVEHDGSFDDIHAAVTAVRAEAQRAADAGEPPVVLTFDTMSAEWDLLKDWATNRARGSRSNKSKLERDPNFEVKVTPNYWNDANDRHRKLMRLLMTFPGIVLVTARGKEVAAIENGQPVEGKKDYRVEGHKTLGFDASCWLRLDRNEPGIVVGCRSVTAGIRPGYDPPQPLAKDWSLEGIIFDTLGCDPGTAHVRDLVEGRPDRTPEQIADEAINPATGFERIKELYGEAKTFLAAVVPNERGADEPLGDLLIRLGKARAQAPPTTRLPENPADDPRVRRMFALLDQAEIKEKEARLAWYSEVTGRAIGTTRNLTPADVELLIQRTEAYIKQSTPPAGVAA